MDTKFWGPGGWKLLHTISFGVPEKATIKEIEKYRKFYEMIQYILPCEKCRNNYKEHIKEFPIKTITTKETCKRWLYNIHNSATNSIRQEERTLGINPEYEMIKDKYEALCKKRISKNSQIWDFIYTVAYMYRGDMTEERYNGYIYFYELLGEVIPFIGMKDIYKEHIKRNPIKEWIINYRTLMKWIYEYEKLVYKSIGKEIITFEERINTIENYDKICSNKELKKCRKELMITK